MFGIGVGGGDLDLSGSTTRKNIYFFVRLPSFNDFGHFKVRWCTIFYRFDIIDSTIQVGGEKGAGHRYLTSLTLDCQKGRKKGEEGKLL